MYFLTIFWVKNCVLSISYHFNFKWSGVQKKGCFGNLMAGAIQKSYYDIFFVKNSRSYNHDKMSNFQRKKVGVAMFGALVCTLKMTKNPF